MRQLILRLTFPLAFISFWTVNKWWYGIAIDAKDVYFYGFPFIYKCEGFHTSLSTQYFVIELLLDFVLYFGIALLVTWMIYHFWKIRIPRMIATITWVLIGAALIGFSYLSFLLDDRYEPTRDFDVKIFDSGFTVWEGNLRDREKYNEVVKDWMKEHN